jgi:hypothetical protein
MLNLNILPRKIILKDTEYQPLSSSYGNTRKIILKDTEYQLFIYKDKMFNDVTWGIAYARGTYFCDAEDCPDKELGETMLIDYSQYSLEDAITGVMKKLKGIKEQYKGRLSLEL